LGLPGKNRFIVGEHAESGEFVKAMLEEMEARIGKIEA
jgi:hypothetical protein